MIIDWLKKHIPQEAVQHSFLQHVPSQTELIPAWDGQTNNYCSSWGITLSQKKYHIK